MVSLTERGSGQSSHGIHNSLYREGNLASEFLTPGQEKFLGKEMQLGTLSSYLLKQISPDFLKDDSYELRTFVPPESASEFLRAYGIQDIIAPRIIVNPKNGKLAVVDLQVISALSSDRTIDIGTHQKNVEKGKNARLYMIESNLPWAYRIASKEFYPTGSVTKEDLRQAATEGLIKAVDRYDPNTGTRLTTFATSWIRQTIGLELSWAAPMIRLPDNIVQALRNWKKACEKTQSSCQRILTGQEKVELAAKMWGISPEKANQVLLVTRVGSWDQLTEREGKNPVKGRFLASSEPNPHLPSKTKPHVEAAMDGLTEKQRKTIKEMFGFEDGIEKTHEEVSALLNISVSSVQQRAEIAMARLKNGLSRAA